MSDTLKLHEWVARGRQNGTIQDVSTVIWAYCMDEQQALNWIADIVTGKVCEGDALAAMEVTLRVDNVLGDLDWSNMYTRAEDNGENGLDAP